MTRLPFAFRTDVRLNADAPPAEIVQRLVRITAPRWSFNRAERSKPLRGRAALSNGLLRWPLTSYRVQSARHLRFDLISARNGSVLVGSFVMMLPLRIPVLIWMGLAVLTWLGQSLRDVVHHGSARVIGRDLLFVLIGLCMGSGYLWIVYLVGRSRDRNLVQVLRAVLGSADGASAVAMILSQPGGSVSFTDPPANGSSQ